MALNNVDWCAMLADAREAKHELLTGKRVQQLRDQNGETLTFTSGSASLSDLENYIKELEAKCPSANGMRRVVNRPLGFLF